MLTRALLTIFAFGTIFVVGASLQQTTLDQGKTLAERTEEVLKACSSADDRPRCYDEKIPHLTETLSLEQAFEVTKLVQQRDPTYGYCHVLGHRLSERETAKDPGQWKGVLARCPSGVCSNGCVHGAFQGRFRDASFSDADQEKLKAQLAGICDERPGWNPTGMEQATCYHALGHLLMYVTNGDIVQSVALCEKLIPTNAPRNYVHPCSDGAFMQIFQPLDREDKTLVAGKQPAKEEIVSFCGQFTAPHQTACWTGAWPLFLDEIKTPEGLLAFCSKLADSEQTHCYRALFYILPVQFQLNQDQIAGFCQILPPELTGRCFSGAAARFLETDARLIDESLRMCASAFSAGARAECYVNLAREALLIFREPEELASFCKRFPQPWDANCLISIDDGI